MSGGGGFGKSQSSNASFNAIDPTQAGYLNRLWSQGQSLANQQGQQPQQAASQISGSLMPQMMGNLSQLTNNPFLQSLQQMSNPNAGMVQQNVDLLGQDLNRQFSEQLLPAIQGNAIGAGSLGGSRQGVAQGLAAQGITDAFARGSADIRNQALARAQQAASTGGQLFGQGLQAGFNAVPTIMNLGMSPYSAAWMPLQQLSGLIGRPQTIGGSMGRSQQYNMHLGER